MDQKYAEYNQPGFIEHDPVSIPHLFSKKQDIEIAGFFAATFAWGQRVTIIRKCKELLQIMDNDPYKFMLHSSEEDLKGFVGFKHRTFNDTDALYFIQFFKQFYRNHESLEEAFTKGMSVGDEDVKTSLVSFHNLFFDLPDYPKRTMKHVATPARKSACKRINMFLRWMVRKDDCGVDFGIWDKIEPSQLICPCDLHVMRVSKKLGLISRDQSDWQTAKELTDNLKSFDPIDPVKYDFALFGLGVEEKF